MTKLPHANNPNAFSNNDPNGDTFGEFLVQPMEPTEAEKRAARAKANEAALQAALDAHFAAKKGA